MPSDAITFALDFCGGAIPETLEAAAEGAPLATFDVSQEQALRMGLVDGHAAAEGGAYTLRTAARASGDITWARARQLAEEMGARGVFAVWSVSQPGGGGSVIFDNTNVMPGQTVTLTAEF